MNKARQKKQEIVAQVSELAANSVSLLVADACGVSVPEIEQLRNKAHDMNVKLKVVKNSLANLALKETNHSCLLPKLTGPTMLAFSSEDPSSVAKVFVDLMKEIPELDVKGISLGTDIIEADQLKAVSNLPNKDQAVAMMLGLMLAPVQQLATVLNEIPSTVVRVVNAVADSKQS